MRKRIVSILLLNCFLVNTLHLEWARAGERFPSAVGELSPDRPGPVRHLRPKATSGQKDLLRRAVSGTVSRDGGDKSEDGEEREERRPLYPLKKSPHYASSHAFFGRGLLTEIAQEEIQIHRGGLMVDETGNIRSHKDALPQYSNFTQLLNRPEEPYRKTRELFASLARHHNFRFARGMNTFIRRETKARVLIHPILSDPRHAPAPEIFWEFWVTLLRSSAIRHDPALTGANPSNFTPQVFGLLGEMGRLLLVEKPKREKLKTYVLGLADKRLISLDREFFEHYMDTVDEIEDRFDRNFVDLSRGTRQIYTDFSLGLAIPPIVRLLNPEGWSEEALSDADIPKEFQIRLSTALKRLRRTEEFQRVVRTIDGEGDARVPETAIIGDVKMDARALKLMLDRAIERDVDKVVMMGDIFGKSRGRSVEGGSPLSVYDILRDFEKRFKGRGIYLFGPDELIFLFTMMGYPGLDDAWYSTYGGEEFLEARNKEIRAYNQEAIRQKGEEAELLPEVNMHNFRDDPRLREVAEWMKQRFYIYHLDEFGVLYVNGGLPGAHGARESVQFKIWDRIEELIRTTDTFKANVFHVLVNVNLSPVMTSGWKKESQALNLEEFLPSIQVDGEGGHEVNAVMTGAPNFNINNRSFGNDFDDGVETEGGMGVALRFVGRNGIVLERYRETVGKRGRIGRWRSSVEEPPESLLNRIRENAVERIQLVAAQLNEENAAVLSALTPHGVSEEDKILRWVRGLQADVRKGAKISPDTEGPLISVARDTLYSEGEKRNREDLMQALGIEVFHGNILYNEDTQEAILLVGKEGLGRSYITWLLVGATVPKTGARFYPGWRLVSHELTRMFTFGGMVFGGTRPLRELQPEWRELFYRDREGRVVKTGILPKEEVVRISRVILLTDEEIAVAARARLGGLFGRKGEAFQEKKVREILAIQEEARQVLSDALEGAFRKMRIEKFHVGVTRDIRSVRLPKIAATIHADVGQNWWGSRWGAWFQTHFPRGATFYQFAKEWKREREFPEKGPSKGERKEGRDEEDSRDGGIKHIEEIAEVTNPLGLHVRPSGVIAKIVNASKSEVLLAHEETGKVADASNIMELLMLAAPQGTKIRIVAEGEDAEEVVAAIKEELKTEYERSQDGGAKSIKGVITITNSLGLHRRLAAEVVKVAQRFKATRITLQNVTEGSQEADARSIMSIMMLAASQGHSVQIRVEGGNPEEAMEAVKQAIYSEEGRAWDGGRKIVEVGRQATQSLSGVRFEAGEKEKLEKGTRDFVSLWGYHYLGQRIERLGKKSMRILIGGDPRRTGKAVRDAQVVGFLTTAQEKDAGLDIVDLGVLPTPMMESAVRTLEADGGVIITASHNPPHWNGMKFLTGAAEPGEPLVTGGSILSVEDMEEDLRDKRVVPSLDEHEKGDTRLSLAFEKVTPARIRQVLSKESQRLREDARRGYLDFVKKTFLIDDRLLGEMRKSAARIKAVLDPNGGAATGVNQQSMDYFGFQTVEIETPLGEPARPIEPVDEALTLLKERIRKEKADLGVGYDWDADRGNLVFANPAGEFEKVDPQDVAAFNVAMFLSLYDLSGKLEEGKEVLVVGHDPTSGRMEEAAKAFGAKVVKVEVGEVNVVSMMKKHQEETGETFAPIGVEAFNGGTVFGESKSRDGFMTTLLAGLALADPRIFQNWLEKSRQSRPVSEPLTLWGIFQTLPKYYSPNDQVVVEGIDQKRLKITMEELFQTYVRPLGEGRFRIEGVPGRVYEKAEFLHYNGLESGPDIKEGEGGMEIRLVDLNGNASFMWLRASKTESGGKVLKFRRMADSKDEAEANALFALIQKLFSQTVDEMRSQDGGRRMEELRYAPVAEQHL